VRYILVDVAHGGQNVSGAVSGLLCLCFGLAAAYYYFAAGPTPPVCSFFAISAHLVVAATGLAMWRRRSTVHEGLPLTATLLSIALVYSYLRGPGKAIPMLFLSVLLGSLILSAALLRTFWHRRS
jgi:hypothetical protein